jgi:restriction system protein
MARKSIGEKIFVSLVKAAIHDIKSASIEAELRRKYQPPPKATTTVKTAPKPIESKPINNKDNDLDNITEMKLGIINLNLKLRNISVEHKVNRDEIGGDIYYCKLTHTKEYKSVVIEEKNLFVFLETIKVASKKLEEYYEWGHFVNRVEINRKIEEANKIIKKLNNSIENLLHNELLNRCKFLFTSIATFDPYREPEQPLLEKLPTVPNEFSYNPKLNILERNFPKYFGKEKVAESTERYNKALREWEVKKSEIEAKNVFITNEYNKILESSKREYDEKLNEAKNRIEEFESACRTGEKNAILNFFKIIILRTELPFFFPQHLKIDFVNESKMLFIEYELPNSDEFITMQEIKYIKVRNEFRRMYLSESKKDKLYESTLYNLTLVILHRVFKQDRANFIDMISFNGFVNFINKATGNEQTSTILSIVVNRKDIEDVNLNKVDPKICFRSLKGVSAAKLINLTPINPIIVFDKRDKRFKEHYGVADSLDDSYNLAEMSWEDFEHLVREIFEKEFSSGGGDVKVTQSSRDGGVDAIAFDPDPIRGGKIVIQAKRYNNVVGVTAVRDLYGTIMNEGANKGILVTTSHYGSDAYNFAKDKPITLLNGANLLHLLEKHGYKAKIEVKK